MIKKYSYKILSKKKDSIPFTALISTGFNFKTLALCCMLFSSSIATSQLVNFHYANNDKYTRRKLVEITGYIVARDFALKRMNGVLKNMINDQKNLLKNDYQKTRYDKEANEKFKESMASTGAFGTGSIFARYINASYMTKNKKKYIKRIHYDKLALAALMNIDPTTIHSDSRQQAYRLRNRLLKQYSNNDKAVRNLLMLPAAAYAVENKTELLKFLKDLEIIL